jgi:hypothetical protein
MKKRFKFLGDSGAYIFLYVVGEPVPEYHAWREAHPSPWAGSRGRAER